jgi:hypothetical protein
MSRERWRDFLEAVGFLAIILSLVFVGLETRNSAKQTEINTQAMEIAAYQELMNNIADINTMSVQSTETAAVMAKVFGFPDLDDSGIERVRIWNAALMLFRHGDIAFFMYQHGAIDEDRLRSALHPLPLSSREGRDIWNARKNIFVEEYQLYIDHLIEEGNYEKF